MKNRFILFVVVGMVALLAFADTGFCRDRVSLYDMLRKSPVVKVAVSKISNSSKEDRVDTDDLKRRLEDALGNRRSIHFEVVEDAKEADIIIDCDVTLYYWASEDPLDMILLARAIIMGALTIKSYAYLEALFTVTDAGKKEILWNKKLKIDLIRKSVSLQDSLILINEKTVRTFFRECFSKGRVKPGRMI